MVDELKESEDWACSACWVVGLEGKPPRNDPKNECTDIVPLNLFNSVFNGLYR